MEQDRADNTSSGTSNTGGTNAPVTGTASSPPVENVSSGASAGGGGTGAGLGGSYPPGVSTPGAGGSSGWSETGSASNQEGHSSEAMSRFNAALAEAKAGAAALGTEARERVTSYREQAMHTGENLTSEAAHRANDLAYQGKARASEALVNLSKLVSENAAVVDRNLGPRYGDYCRSASRSLQDTAEMLNAKNVDELGDDARQFIRTSPGMAVGIAAFAGFMFGRMFSGGSDR